MGGQNALNDLPQFFKPIGDSGYIREVNLYRPRLSGLSGLGIDAAAFQIVIDGRQSEAVSTDAELFHDL